MNLTSCRGRFATWLTGSAISRSRYGATEKAHSTFKIPFSGWNFGPTDEISSDVMCSQTRRAGGTGSSRSRTATLMRSHSLRAGRPEIPRDTSGRIGTRLKLKTCRTSGALNGSSSIDDNLMGTAMRLEAVHGAAPPVRVISRERCRNPAAVNAFVAWARRELSVVPEFHQVQEHADGTQIWVMIDNSTGREIVSARLL